MLRMIWTSAAVHQSQVFWVVKTPDRYRSMPPVHRDRALAETSGDDTVTPNDIAASVAASTSRAIDR